MIISPGRRYIFVHIPKTGGTSLAMALEQKAMKDDILIGDTPKAKRRLKRLKNLTTSGRLWKHSTLSDIDGLVAADRLASYFVFTIVRNPWDRLVSYYHWLRTQSFDHPAVGIAKSKNFAAFLADDQIAASFSENPYMSYVCDVMGRNHADLFMRLERFEHDFERLKTRLNLNLATPERVNMSPRARDWRPYYTDQSAALVGEMCAADIARFEYGFDG